MLPTSGEESLSVQLSEPGRFAQPSSGDNHLHYSCPIPEPGTCIVLFIHSFIYKLC